MKPSDEDLDCLLKTWTAPSPDSLEARLRRAYRDGHAPEQMPGREASPAVVGAEGGRNRGIRVWARWITGFLPISRKALGVIAGAVVLLTVIARALPR